MRSRNNRLAAAAPAPLLAHGADIGLRVADVLLAEIDQPDSESPSWVPPESQAARLRQVRKEFSRLLASNWRQRYPIAMNTEYTNTNTQ